MIGNAENIHSPDTVRRNFSDQPNAAGVFATGACSVQRPRVSDVSTPVNTPSALINSYSPPTNAKPIKEQRTPSVVTKCLNVNGHPCDAVCEGIWNYNPKNGFCEATRCGKDEPKFSGPVQTCVNPQDALPSGEPTCPLTCPEVSSDTEPLMCKFEVRYNGDILAIEEAQGKSECQMRQKMCAQFQRKNDKADSFKKLSCKSM